MQIDEHHAVKINRSGGEAAVVVYCHNVEGINIFGVRESEPNPSICMYCERKIDLRFALLCFKLQKLAK